MSINNCPNCGAANNHFTNKCDFCGSPLKEVPTDSISSEDLVACLSEWIGRYTADGTLKLEHDGKVHEYEPEEIEGVISKYSTLLQMRALRDKSLTSIYQEYAKKFEEKRKNEKRKSNLVFISIVVFFAVALIVLVCLKK